MATIKSTVISSIKDRLPELLEKTKVPYTVDQLRIKVKEFNNVEQMVNTNGDDWSEFSIRFGEDYFEIRVNVLLRIFNLLFKFIDTRYLDSMLVHELLHYFEMQCTPKNWHANTSLLFPSVKKHKQYMGYVVDELKDAIVYSMTPSPYMEDFQAFKIIETAFLNSSDIQESYQLLVKENTVRQRYLCNFHPPVSLFYYLNTLRCTALSNSILEQYEQQLKLSGNVENEALFTRGKQLVTQLIESTRKTRNFEEDLSGIIENTIRPLFHIPHSDFELSYEIFVE